MTTTLTRTLTVAAGVFAPGHLAELTRYLPFELVDDVLAQTGTLQQRLRALSSRTGVYFVLALGLFPRIGYARVWASCARAWPVPAWWCLRCRKKRCGNCAAGLVRPRLRRYSTSSPGRWHNRRPRECALPGCARLLSMGLTRWKIPDTERNRCWIGRIWYRLAFAGYPTLRLMSLVETGTRGLLGAVIGGAIGTPVTATRPT